MANGLSRRQFLHLAATAAAGAALAACGAPGDTPEPGEEPTDVTGGAPEAEAVQIEFWTMNYGDPEEWMDMLGGWAEEFKAESNVTVDVQMINWSNAVNTLLLMSQGGAHPDAADMFWLYSLTELGGGQYGPMPITQYQEEYWPDLEDRFFAGSLKDVFWKGEFFGVPWRGDIRPMIYRTDFLEEAGFDAPPQTWDEVIDMGQELTKRDEAGNVTQWGFALAASVPMQQFLQYLWQAGGEYMTADGQTATLDTPEMRESLQWMYDLLWTHEIHSTELMEPSYDVETMFQAGQLAVVGSVPDDWAKNLKRDFPELDDKWRYALPTMGPANRSSYSGAGYWGVLRGSEKVESAVKWIHFMSQERILQTISEYLGRVSPSKAVMSSEFWTDEEWKQVIVETLEYAHTSQHPSPAWSKVVANDPGSVLYDMYYEALVLQQPFDDVLPRAEQRMQEEMDKIE